MGDLRSTVIESYEAFAPNSRELILEARRCFPGGDTRMTAHYAPYPLFVQRAAGSRLYDADGHALLDFMNNFTSLIHGHAFAPVVAAVTEQVQRGTAYAAPTLSQVALGELIRSRVPSVEQLRFTSSGSEATLMALRCARAVTGRQKIMKMEGGYHGSYELAEVSLVPFPGQCGPLEAPHPVAIDASIPESALSDAVICPYNEPALARALIDRHARDLAAVIVEPALASMGMIPATTEFLSALREATAQHGIVLVFDEVVTLRLSLGGAQQVHGVTPDLTAMGKIIGGGLPIGAFGGREDLMRVFHPEQSRPVMHASTFSGNPLSMAAGFAAMDALDAPATERLNELGERLRVGIGAAFARHGIRGQAVGLGSLANIHFTDAVLASARDALAGVIRSGSVNQLLHLEMLKRGVASAARLMYCTSTAMTDEDVDYALDALDDALKGLKPGIEKEKPELLV
jgi:glutamate-1-semialdehyde 2,1-aminomutase